MSHGKHIRDDELELLALGALPDEEAGTLRAHAIGCGECAKRLAKTRGYAAMLAFDADQQNPCAEVKGKLFARITADRLAEQTFVARNARKPRAAWWNWVAVPSMVILSVVSLVEWRELQRLNAELFQARRATADLQLERARSENLLRVIASPATITVQLAGTPDMPEGTGRVKYNEIVGTVVCSMQLPPLPEDRIYQLWLIPANGRPISAGMFQEKRAARAFGVGSSPSASIQRPLSYHRARRRSLATSWT